MHRISFKMFLKHGFQEEYKRRHDELWPELKELLKKNEISNYNIFLDKDKNELFAFLHVNSKSNLSNLKSNKVMKKWWYFMSDIMECNEDKSPKTIELKQVFFLE